MFDTMTVTKVGGALCGSLLVFLLINWGAEVIYSTEGGHGDHAEAAYVIEVEGAEDHAGDEEAAPAVDMVALVAAADAAKGEKVFAKCKGCHKLDGNNGTGPHLDGVVGRPIGAAEGFGYSGAMSGHGGEWSIDNLSAFLTNPKAFVPGTKMSFTGLKSDDDRANLIAYLQTQN
jgi:cytochrome c